ncbi:hypothetical protein OG285_32890 [Streptomyces sp. NBC_01471]|uniref:hypothetical protein n=1 Tax=Streptomyces sp. NBC_01471 TaxID=2903879 RepID=UPI00324CB104
MSSARFVGGPFDGASNPDPFIDEIAMLTLLSSGRYVRAKCILTAWTPKLTNVKGTNGTNGAGKYAEANGIVAFTAQIVAKKETNAATKHGFGLTLPKAAKAGVRYVFNLSLDGRDADSGVWTGEAQIYAGSDGSKVDLLRVTGAGTGAAVQNIGFLCGESAGAKEGEIITVTGSYPIA